MELAVYPKYKPSEKDWLCQIPEYWQEKRIKFSLSYIGSGKTPKGGANVYVNEGINLFRSQNVHDSGMRLDDVVRITDAADELQAGTRVKEQDVLLNITGASIGRTSVVPAEALPANVNQHVCILRTEQDKILPSYLHRLLCSKIAKDQILENENGTSREGLNFVQVANLFFPLPGIKEQIQIAKFLDYKTAQIDRLIEKKKALIEKLNEQRIAMITQAVTKGLNPDVPMKKSEEEWFSEVPEHWEIRKLKWTIDNLKNGVWGKDKNGIDDLVCIRVADFNRINFCIDNSNLTLRAIEEKDRSGRLIKKGDLLIEKSGGGENQLVGAVVDFNSSFPAVTSNFVAKMEVSSGFISRYLTYLHNYLYSIRLNYRSIKQTTGIQNLDAELYFSELVAIAPKEEQTQIAKFLDYKTSQIDRLIEKKKALIEKLNEQRTAMITAAVTGKIDVRNIEVPEED